MHSDWNTLEVELDGEGVLTVWMNNPPVNAMSQQMFLEIAALFRSLGRQQSVRAVVVAGRGRHFSAGGDIAELRDIGVDESGEKLRNVREAYWAVLDCPVPVIAALHGAALGGGAALAAVCDVLVASPGATLGVPEITVGIMGGAGHLMRLLPQQHVRWMFLTGRSLDAERLHQLGGVLEIVPESDLLSRARGICAEVLRHSKIAVNFAKQDLRVAEASNLKHVYELEQGLTRELGKYADSWEAATAFLEHRPPVFSNDQQLRRP